MSSAEQSVSSPSISTWGKMRKKTRGWVFLIGKLWGASIFSTCLASPLSSALTAGHVGDSEKGLCAFLPRLMSGSSQGSAVSSRGGVNSDGVEPAHWHAPLAVTESHVWFYEWNKQSDLLIVSYRVYFHCWLFSIKIIVLLAGEWGPFWDVLQQLCLWLRHIQAATREADACVTHLWVIQRKIYHILLMIVINNKFEVQIMGRCWHD